MDIIDCKPDLVNLRNLCVYDGRLHSWKIKIEKNKKSQNFYKLMNNILVDADDSGMLIDCRAMKQKEISEHKIYECWFPYKIDMDIRSDNDRNNYRALYVRFEYIKYTKTKREFVLTQINEHKEITNDLGKLLLKRQALKEIEKL